MAKKICITGVSSGLGYGLAKVYLELGADVYGCSRRKPDALITKGIISLLLRVLSNQKPSDIIQANLDFIDKIGLRQHLSVNRANGLNNMIKKIKFYAIGYNNK